MDGYEPLGVDDRVVELQLFLLGSDFVFRIGDDLVANLELPRAPGDIVGTVADVRQHGEYETGHVPGAINIELGSLALLMFFTAGNLLPPQVLVTPLYVLFLKIDLPWWMSDSMTLYDSYWAVILVNIGFQVGFCVFVLSNFMRTLPKEILEAAIVDGAGVWTQFWRITLPLCRPAIAALATLEFTWIYNDFLWALIFISNPDKLPITSSLNNLRGQFFTDYNLLAAGSVLVALPTILVFLLLQRHFIAGLTLGSSKG